MPRIPIDEDRQRKIESHLSIARERMAVGDLQNALANAQLAVSDLAEEIAKHA